MGNPSSRHTLAMVFHAQLAQRVRSILKRRRGFTEKKMFGGVGFLLNGNMCVGVWKDFLIVRVGMDAYPNRLREAYTREFDITGRVMRGWVMVEVEGLEDDDPLKLWIDQAILFVRTLPGK